MTDTGFITLKSDINNRKQPDAMQASQLNNQKQLTIKKTKNNENNFESDDDVCTCCICEQLICNW